MSDRYLQYQIGHFQSSARMLLGAGAVVALLGLSAPWFLAIPSVNWTGGWDLMTDGELGWIAAIYAAYVLALVLAIRFPGRVEQAPAALAVVVTFAVLASLLALSAALADARVDARGGLSRIEVNFGVWLVLAGAAAAEVGAVATWALYTLEDLLGLEPASSAPEPRH